MKNFKHWPRGTAQRRVTVATGLFSLGLLVSLTLTSMAGAGASATSEVSLQTAKPFAILAGTQITNVPTSTIKGDVGLSPATGAGIGLACGEVTGKIYSVDAAGPLPCRVENPGLLGTAKSDLTNAYVDAAGRTPDTTFAAVDNQLGTQVLVPGVYRFGHGTTANLIGTLTLDAADNSDAVWIFQATSDLVTASSSVVALIRGAQACNVYWQVTSSATLGTGSTFIGTIMALTSIWVTTGVTIEGRVLARNGEVTLDQDTITRRNCSASPSPPPPPPPAPPTTTTATTTTTTTTAAPAAPAPTATTPTATTPTSTVAAVALPAPAKPTPVKAKPAAKKPAAKPVATAQKRIPAPRPRPVPAKHPVGLTG